MINFFCQENLSMFLITFGLAVALAGGSMQYERKPPTLPETFSANANVVETTGAAAANFKVRVDRYVSDRDRDAIRTALKTGGYAAFLTALRAAPGLGELTHGGQTVTVRWATQEPVKNGRTIVLITDKPLAFVGGGAVNAKPREGYEVAVIRMNMDDSGLGNGEMAAAAKVKPGGATGVEIDDYAENPIKLVSVVKAR
jgi:hypothetical protein